MRDFYPLMEKSVKHRKKLSDEIFLDNVEESYENL